MNEAKNDLHALRLRLGATQKQMAEGMGMPLRSYQDVEDGKNPIRPIHKAAAKLASLQIALINYGPDALDQLDAEIREIISRIVRRDG